MGRHFAFNVSVSVPIAVEVEVEVSGYSSPAVTSGRPDDWAPAEYEDSREFVSPGRSRRGKSAGRQGVNGVGSPHPGFQPPASFPRAVIPR
jgi:hypothetical protein